MKRVWLWIDDWDVYVSKYEEDRRVLFKKSGELLGKVGKEKTYYASVMICSSILESGSAYSKLARNQNYEFVWYLKADYKGQICFFYYRAWFR